MCGSHRAAPGAFCLSPLSGSKECLLPEMLKVCTALSSIGQNGSPQSLSVPAPPSQASSRNKVSVIRKSEKMHRWPFVLCQVGKKGRPTRQLWLRLLITSERAQWYPCSTGGQALGKRGQFSRTRSSLTDELVWTVQDSGLPGSTLAPALTPRRSWSEKAAGFFLSFFLFL